MRRGEVCGAVTGALMALGLEYGDENNRKSTKSLEFMKAFREQYGSLLCKELLARTEKEERAVSGADPFLCLSILKRSFPNE